MSDYVDDMLAQYGYPDDGTGPAEPRDYLDMSDQELIDETALAREPKIVSIRRWPHKLSEKQRWCLANWLADYDNRNPY